MCLKLSQFTEQNMNTYIVCSLECNRQRLMARKYIETDQRVSSDLSATNRYHDGSIPYMLSVNVAFVTLHTLYRVCVGVMHILSQFECVKVFVTRFLVHKRMWENFCLFCLKLRTIGSIYLQKCY